MPRNPGDLATIAETSPRPGDLAMPWSLATVILRRLETSWRAPGNPGDLVGIVVRS